jgi:endonuclease/exonuclease/phosphatase family metal-dependent hydrolase
MTFNIRLDHAGDGPNQWEARRQLAVELIRSRGPDILGLQEALRNQLNDLRSAFPEYEELGVGRDDGDTTGEYSAILFRRDLLEVEETGTFWFSDSPSVPGSRHWGNRYTRICTWGRLRLRGSPETVTVYNMHLDHESQPSRERSVLLLTDTLRQRDFPGTVVVMGDVNAGESNPVVGFLLGQQTLMDAAGRERSPAASFVDTYRQRHPEADTSGTYHGFTGIPGRDKIDYIFVSSKVEILDAAIVRLQRGGRFPSDHFPVTATIRLPRFQRDAPSTL